jgi:hypothetical protein
VTLQCEKAPQFPNCLRWPRFFHFSGSVVMGETGQVIIAEHDEREAGRGSKFASAAPLFKDMIERMGRCRELAAKATRFEQSQMVKAPAIMAARHVPPRRMPLPQK